MLSQNFKILPIIAIPVLIFLHICNILLIIKKKKLHKINYYLILNLTIADLTLAVFGFVNILIFDYENVDLYLAVTAGYYQSIITTVQISIDRYIAIKFCLRYTSIVTNKRLISLIAVSWFLSAILAFLPMFEAPKYINNIKYKRLSSDIIRYSLIVLSSVVMIAQAVYTVSIRKKHVKKIKRTESQFGNVSGERDIIRKLRQSMKDVMNLNMLTLLFVVSSNTVMFYSDYVAPLNRYLTLLLFSFYIGSNPFVYACIMSDLRAEYFLILQSIATYFFPRRLTNTVSCRSSQRIQNTQL